MSAAPFQLPLNVEHPYGEDGTYISDAVTALVCKVTGTRAEEDKKAAYIVRCVNAHADLVVKADLLDASRAECQRLREEKAELVAQLKRTADCLHGLIKDESDDPSTGVRGWTHFHTVLADARATLARAALAKATGGAS